MRDLDVPDGVLSQAFGWSCQVSSWRGGVLLAAEVPVVGGSLSVDGSAQVPERLTLTVPERGWDGSRTRSWVPDSPYHPLARYGQTLDVTVAVESAVSGQSGSVTLARCQVQDWSHDDVARTVSVECVGLLQRAADARFHRPEVPRSGGTFASELVRLAPAGVPVEIDGALVDRAVPTSFAWDESRIDALYDLADAWPARLRMDSAGVLRVLPALPDVPDPILTLTDGERGTVVSAPTQDTRDGIPNVIVFRGSETDNPARSPIVGVEARVLGGALAPEEYREVVEFFSSPLVKTAGEAQAAVNTRLANATRPALQRVVSCVPDPRIEVDDPVLVVRDGEAWSGWVVGYDLPLVVSSESDRMQVRVGISGRVVLPPPPGAPPSVEWIIGGKPGDPATIIEGGSPGDPAAILVGGRV